MRLQIAQTHATERGDDVKAKLLFIVVLAGGFDVDAIFFVPYIQPVSEWHSLWFVVGASIYGSCCCTELLHALLSSFSVNVLVLGFACAGVYSDLESAFPAAVCAFARL